MIDGKYYSQVRGEMLDCIDKKRLDSFKVLDVGAGEGGFIQTLKANLNLSSVWAIEPSLSAKKIDADTVLELNVEGSLDQLPNQYFDLVIFNDVLEHLEDPWNVLKRIKSCLAENGEIIISVPNFLFIHTFKRVLLGDFRYEDFGVMDKTHLRFYTKKSLIRMLNECGYRVEYIEGINGFYTWKYKVLSVCTFGLIKNWLHQQWACRAVI